MIIWLLSFLYSILVIVLPFEVVLGHFLPFWLTTLLTVLFVGIYNFSSGWTDIVVWVLYIVGFFFVFDDFPTPACVVYCLVFAILLIKTIYSFTSNPGRKL